jgi:two-component system, LytTR family, response regulator
MKIIIIEDEPAAQQLLSRILQDQYPQVTIAAIADNVADAVHAIDLHQPDIIFLDIEIRQGTGFNVLERVNKRSFEVIFTTTFNTYAVDAFRHHALDYLLKPLSAAMVKDAVDRCIAQTKTTKKEDNIGLLLQQIQSLSTPKTRLPVHTPEGISFLDIPDIIYVEANGNYCDFQMRNGNRITSSRKLKEMETGLPFNQFFRIHHSYIVNLHFISKYHKGRGGYVVLLNGQSLPVASNRKDDFLAWLG